MFGHVCDEPIALFRPHPWNNQIVLCTTKQNLILLDIFKNRSIRNFSIPSSIPKEAQQIASKSSPIGLFFVDNIACRAAQSIIKSTIQQLPSDHYICLVFPRGLFIWNHTLANCHWHVFEFTASCVVQTPDSLFFGDTSNKLWQFSLINFQVKSFAKIQGTPTALFLTTYSGDQYGILSISNSGSIEFFSASGKLSSQATCEVSKTITFDIYTNTLYLMNNKKTIHTYSISPSKIEKIGECSFSGVTAGETKPTNYTVQQIAPCHLPLSPRPLFYAICDSQTLLIGSATRVVQKVDSFNIVRKIKKLNCSLMLSHPTDLALLLVATENFLLILDMFAHLPRVVPSLAIPEFIPQSERQDGIYTVRRNNKIISVMNHSNGTYTIYDVQTRQRIATKIAIDVIIGPNKKYADLKFKAATGQSGSRTSSGKDGIVHKAKGMQIEVYDAEANTQKSILVHLTRDLEYPMRLVSFGDFFALICAKNQLDLSFNMQQPGKTGTLVYRWSTLDPISLQFDGCSMVAYESPYIALASPNNYAVFDTENQMELKVRREKRVFSFTFFEGKLYLLTIDGLEIDNFKTVELVSSRFSHLITKDKNAPATPMNAIMIKEVQHGPVTLLDISGNSSMVGIPEEHEDDESAPLIVKVANAADPWAAAGEASKIATPTEKKNLMMMMMKEVGWDTVLRNLSESEKAACEIAENNAQGSNGTQYQQEFRNFLMHELEIQS